MGDTGWAGGYGLPSRPSREGERLQTDSRVPEESHRFRESPLWALARAKFTGRGSPMLPNSRSRGWTHSPRIPGGLARLVPAPGCHNRPTDNPVVERQHESQQCRGAAPPPRRDRPPVTPIPRARFPRAAGAARDAPTCQGAGFLLAAALTPPPQGGLPGLGVPQSWESLNFPCGSCCCTGGSP